jgi:hypothetical protein
MWFSVLCQMAAEIGTVQLIKGVSLVIFIIYGTLISSALIIYLGGALFISEMVRQVQWDRRFRNLFSLSDMLA